MKRRSFLQTTTSIPVLPFVGLTSAAEFISAPNSRPFSGGPYHYKRSLEKARQAPGFIFNFIVNKEQTNGNYSVIEGKARKGAEPSLHVHLHEDEAFYILDGEMIVTIGEKKYHVTPGDYIFLPRNVPHTQEFLTDIVHVLLFISPAGLEEYFWSLSTPALNYDLPELSTDPPSTEMIKSIIAANAKFGITSLR